MPAQSERPPFRSPEGDAPTRPDRSTTSVASEARLAAILRAERQYRAATDPSVARAWARVLRRLRGER